MNIYAWFEYGYYDGLLTFSKLFVQCVWPLPRIQRRDGMVDLLRLLWVPLALGAFVYLLVI